MVVKASDYRKLPSKPGIYLFLGSPNKVLYIGKAKSLKDRVSSYFAKSAQLNLKTKILVSKTKKVKTINTSSEIEALLLEVNYIKKYKPKYNSRLTDGKAYPLIRITVKDKYPKVLTARQETDKESLYFGPFPNAGTLRLVLRTIRRIFPYQSVVNHPKRVCLHYHLGLCPCPGVSLFKDTPYLRSILVEEYRKNINHIIDFLKGETKKLLKSLEKERNILSKKEAFEKAEGLQKKIDAILYVTSPIYQKFDYKVNSNLEKKTRKKELSSLKECLNRYYSVKKLERIECFDISNISGTNATGSMVVFSNGKKDPSKYRRFKIKSVDKVPNDFAMMQEVILRRLNHKEWPFPDLIIVDGGKGQVSSALKAVKKQNVAIPVIGLAKREETIIVPLTRHSGNPPAGGASRISFGSKENFVALYLPKDSPTRNLVMRIRDEAHRFAIYYHRKLRSKAQLN